MNKFLTRLFDILFSAAGILVLLPFFPFIALAILLDSPGGVIFCQQRVGKDGRDFTLYKLRTMRKNNRGALITVGTDNRITRTGRLLRKSKLDELPQLWNVLSGTMSLVGPRPEVRKYVELYTAEQQKVLSVRPGVTDFASIVYRDENELLARSADPEKTYVEEIMPHKIRLNMKYIEDQTIGNYFSVLIKTIKKL